MNKENIKAFLPNEFKSLEIDVEKKVFNVNGVPFGKGASHCTIWFDAEGFNFHLEIESRIELGTYNKEGKKESGETYPAPPL